MKLSDVFYALADLHSRWNWDNGVADVCNKIGDALAQNNMSL